MKRIIFSVVIACFLVTTFAQSPNAFKYQAIIRDNSGNIISEQSVGIKVEIIKGATGGDVVYTETHSETTTQFGLINLEIGNGTSSNDFESITWEEDDYFLSISIDETGGTTFKYINTSKLLSVPYAFHAQTAETLSSVTHYVGEKFGGGVVFYTWANGKHGYIASLDFLSTEADWETAINLCDSYIIDSFDDWFLPSADLIKLMLNQSHFIDNTLENDGDENTTTLSQSSQYWTNNESTGNPDYAIKAYYSDFYIHNIGIAPKTTLFSVRAVREF